MWLTGHRKGGFRGKEEIQSKVKHGVDYIREAEDRTLTGIMQRLHLLPEAYFYYWTNSTYVQKDRFYRTNHNVCLQKNPCVMYRFTYNLIYILHYFISKYIHLINLKYTYGVYDLINYNTFTNKSFEALFAYWQTCQPWRPKKRHSGDFKKWK